MCVSICNSRGMMCCSFARSWHEGLWSSGAESACDWYSGRKTPAVLGYNGRQAEMTQLRVDRESRLRIRM